MNELHVSSAGLLGVGGGRGIEAGIGAGSVCQLWLQGCGRWPHGGAGMMNEVACGGLSIIY